MNLLKIGSKHTRKHSKTGQGRAKQGKHVKSYQLYFSSINHSFQVRKQLSEWFEKKEAQGRHKRENQTFFIQSYTR